MFGYASLLTLGQSNKFFASRLIAALWAVVRPAHHLVRCLLVPSRK